MFYIRTDSGLPGGSDCKKPASSTRDLGSIPGSGRSPGEGNGYPLLPGESHGQRGLAGDSPWGQTQLSD